MKVFKSILFIVFTIATFVVKAQIVGIPYIQNYPPEKYNGYSQNWTAEQDNRGVMYFGNGKGILEYNGKTWRRFYTNKVSTVLLLGKDYNGRVYVGGENEIGYIAPDSTGLTKFYDLTYLIPEKDKDFSYVWHVYANEKGVYFVTPEKIIRIHNKEIFVHYPKTYFFTAFMVNSQFYVQDNELGLLIESNDSLIPPNNCQKFGDIRGVFPYDKKNVLFVTQRRGCFLYDGENPAKHFKTEAELLLKEFQFYKGTMLLDSSYAFGTTTNGIITMNRNGKVANIINEEVGLLGNTSYALFTDKQGGVWSMLANLIFTRILKNFPKVELTDFTD